MYIWIFLATIMVALNFLNLSQRPDADGAINEIKASMVINRFRSEHIAFVRTMECELILHLNSNSWLDVNNNGTPITVKTVPPEEGNDPMDLEYTGYSDNLPLGYTQDNSLLAVHHTIVCTKERLEDVGDNDYEQVDCDSTQNRYALSYAKIPSKWLNKKADKNGAFSPLPTLVGLMSKVTGSGSIYGWTDCTLQGCELKGYSVKIGYSDKEEQEDGSFKSKLKYTRISPDSGVWQIPDFESTCKYSQEPCLFAYEKFSSGDKGKHCKHLVCGHSEMAARYESLCKESEE